MFVRRLLAAGLMLGLSAPLWSQDANPAAKPLNRDNARHKQFLKIVAKGEGDVIFLGDSITQGWEGAGKKAWARHFAPLKPVNLGIGGDQTGHVLWRITEGKETRAAQAEGRGHHDRHEQHGRAHRPSRSPAASRRSSTSCASRSRT